LRQPGCLITGPTCHRRRIITRSVGAIPIGKTNERKILSTSDVRDVSRALKQRYGNPRHGNPRRPLDDLIFIILSTRTRGSSFSVTFQRLKRSFPNWNKVYPRDRRKIERILAPGGLSKLKARQILGILAQLKSCFGRTTLAPLSRMKSKDAEAFLTALPGVGPKIAKCVIMYTFDGRVLPVDVHVHRLATRLGFLTKKRPDTSQELIEHAVPAKLRYSFHVNAIAHGRSLCFAQRPRCYECPISKWCQFYREHRGPKA
jgi:endonuclease III